MNDNLALSLVFGLISMVSFGISGALLQPLAQKYGSLRTLFARGLITSSLLFLAAIPSFNDLNGRWDMVAVSFIIGFFGYLPLLAFTQGLKISKIGIVAPIAGTSPLVSVILAYFFLNVPLHGLQWVAILIVIAANVVASFNPKSWRDSNIFQLSSGIPFALAAAIGWGLFFFLMVYPTQAIGPWIPAWLVEVGVTVAAWIHMMLISEKPNLQKIRSTSLITSGVLLSVALAAYGVGVKSYNVGIVVVLSNSNAVISMIIGHQLYKERLRPIELYAAIGMVVGIALLSTS